MRLPVVLLYALLWITNNAVASEIAAGYQFMYLWYAYRLDVLAAAKDPTHIRTIAPNVRGTAPGATCYFDELMQQVMPQFGENGADTWAGATGVGHELRPDVQSTAVHLVGDGHDTRVGPVEDPEPGKLFNAFIGQVKRFYPLYERITNTVIQAHTVVGSQGDPEFDRATDALSAIHSARIEDLEPFVIQEMDAYTMSRGWLVERKTRLSVLGGEYEVIDWEATFSKRPADTELVQSLKDWITAPDGYMATTPEAAAHVRAMEACGVFEGRLNRYLQGCL